MVAIGEAKEKLNRHVSNGDYPQMTVEPSRKKIAAGKLFGLCTSDLIQTVKGLGFVTGKRSTGYFALGSIDGTRLTNSVNLKTNCVRLMARTTKP